MDDREQTLADDTAIAQVVREELLDCIEVVRGPYYSPGPRRVIRDLDLDIPDERESAAADVRLILRQLKDHLRTAY